MGTTPIRLLVFPNLILSFHRGHVSIVHVIRRRLEMVASRLACCLLVMRWLSRFASQLSHNRIENTAMLVHAVLDTIVDSHALFVDGAVAEVVRIRLSFHRSPVLSRLMLLLLGRTLWMI